MVNILDVEVTRKSWVVKHPKIKVHMRRVPYHAILKLQKIIFVLADVGNFVQKVHSG